MCGSGDDKLRRAPLVDTYARFADHKHVLGQLGVPAAGQNGDDGPGQIEMVLAAEVFAGLCGSHGSNERMADEFCGHACITEEGFFERENTESFGKAAADHTDAPRAPRPEL